MALFSHARDKERARDQAILVGCGVLGALFAETLARRNENSSITLLDVEESAFLKLSSGFSGLRLHGDGMDPEMLKEAGAASAGLFVAVTESDDKNIFIAKIARELFEIPTVIARLERPEKELVLQGSGILTLTPRVLLCDAFCHILDKIEATDPES